MRSSYSRHAVSKAARKAHKKRESKRKKKLCGIAAFSFSDTRGASKRQLSRRMGSLG